MKQLEKMDEPSDCGKLLLCKSARSGFARDDKRIEEIIQFLEVTNSYFCVHIKNLMFDGFSV